MALRRPVMRAAVAVTALLVAPIVLTTQPTMGAHAATTQAAASSADVMPNGAALATTPRSAPHVEAKAAAKPSGNDGLARTPPMGWNDWYSFFCDIDEDLIKQTADAMVASGMRDAGYEYVNIDDCWSAPERDADGNLVADPERFPSGIKALADYVHARGLKLGIYTDVGTKTCAGYPGGYGHEERDARTFAKWHVDFVKVDWCNVPFEDFPGMTQQEVAIELYGRWSKALQQSGRDMVFSVCVWDPAIKSWEWAPEIAHMWRTSFDYGDSWDLMLRNADEVAPLWTYAGPGHWNDPDILMVGIGGMSDVEYQTHFSIWAMAAAPLLAGNDLRHMSEQTLEILTNREVIAVDQDPLGVAGRKARSDETSDVWVRPLAGGDYAVLLVNRAERPQLVRTSPEELGISAHGLLRVRDLWRHETTTATGTLSAYLPAHGSAMFRISTSGPASPEPSVAWGATADARVPGLDPPLLEPGTTTPVDGLVVNNGHVPLRDANASLQLPPGWSVRPAPQQELGTVRRDGGEARVTWELTTPSDVAPGDYELTATVTYRVGGSKASGGSASDDGAHASADRPKPRTFSMPFTIPVTVPTPPPSGEPWLSDVDWVESHNGYGPVLRDRNYWGDPLSIRGTTYPKGLWTHPPGDVAYYLGGHCTRLQADLGIDDSTGGRGSVVFEVWAGYPDGRETTVFDSGVVRGTDPVVPLDVDLTDAVSVTLVTRDAGDGVSYDNADWGGIRLTCT
ncbi:MAG TPA: NPCBM/NEW2 domain-containing protein [Actinopolymorphaceae bacterium]